MLELFIKFPLKDFSIRGIARELDFSHGTILKHINGFEKEGFVKEMKKLFIQPILLIYKIKNINFIKGIIWCLG